MFLLLPPASGVLSDAAALLHGRGLTPRERHALARHRRAFGAELAVGELQSVLQALDSQNLHPERAATCLRTTQLRALGAPCAEKQQRWCSFKKGDCRDGATAAASSDAVFAIDCEFSPLRCVVLDATGATRIDCLVAPASREQRLLKVDRAELPLLPASEVQQRAARAPRWRRPPRRPHAAARFASVGPRRRRGAPRRSASSTLPASRPRWTPPAAAAGDAGSATRRERRRRAARREAPEAARSLTRARGRAPRRRRRARGRRRALRGGGRVDLSPAVPRAQAAVDRFLTGGSVPPGASSPGQDAQATGHWTGEHAERASGPWPPAGLRLDRARGRRRARRAAIAAAGARARAPPRCSPLRTAGRGRPFFGGRSAGLDGEAGARAEEDLLHRLWPAAPAARARRRRRRARRREAPERAGARCRRRRRRRRRGSSGGRRRRPTSQTEGAPRAGARRWRAGGPPPPRPRPGARLPAGSPAAAATTAAAAAARRRRPSPVAAGWRRGAWPRRRRSGQTGPSASPCRRRRADELQRRFVRGDLPLGVAEPLLLHGEVVVRRREERRVGARATAPDAPTPLGARARSVSERTAPCAVSSASRWRPRSASTVVRLRATWTETSSACFAVEPCLTTRWRRRSAACGWPVRA